MLNDSFFVSYAEQQVKKLLVWRIVCSEGRLVFRRAWKVFKTFYPLFYKQVIALSLHRIKDKFSLVFPKFSHFPRDANFVKTLKIQVKIYP